jgi:hypothetical protein
LASRRVSLLAPGAAGFTALKGLANAWLGAPSVLANLHHRRIVPLTERELHIYEMRESSNPTSLARSRLLNDRFPREYAATRVEDHVWFEDRWMVASLCDE